MTWTDRRTETLKARWVDGYSAAAIAEHFCITRNAVIGKANRLIRLGQLQARGNPGAAARREKKAACQLPPDSVLAAGVKRPVAMPATNVRTPSKREIALLRAMAALERANGADWRLTQAFRLARLPDDNGAEFLNRLIGKRLVRIVAPARYLLTDAAVAYLPKERRAG